MTCMHVCIYISRSIYPSTYLASYLSTYPSVLEYMVFENLKLLLQLKSERNWSQGTHIFWCILWCSHCFARQGLWADACCDFDSHISQHPDTSITKKFTPTGLKASKLEPQILQDYALTLLQQARISPRALEGSKTEPAKKGTRLFCGVAFFQRAVLFWRSLVGLGEPWRAKALG